MKPRPDVPPPPALAAGSRFPIRPLLFGLAVVGIFALGVIALFAFAPDQSEAERDAELARLMAAPEASESLPPYFYDVASRPTALTVTSSPEGAEVSLNSEALGPTPLVLDALRPGHYTIRLRHPDHPALDTSLYLASGARYHLALDLLSGSAEPGETRPLRGAAPGGIAARPTGRAPRQSPPPESPSPERFARADAATLQRVWHTGSLSVTSEPSGARVLVNGRPRGQTPLALGGLRPGSYEVEVSLRGYETETRSVQVGAGSVHHVEARLTR